MLCQRVVCDEGSNLHSDVRRSTWLWTRGRNLFRFFEFRYEGSGARSWVNYPNFEFCVLVRWTRRNGIILVQILVQRCGGPTLNCVKLPERTSDFVSDVPVGHSLQQPSFA